MREREKATRASRFPVKFTLVVLTRGLDDGIEEDADKKRAFQMYRLIEKRAGSANRNEMN
jgi:hypothetical protein